MVFKSAVDTWLYLLIGLTVTLVVASLAFAHLEAGEVTPVATTLVALLSLALPIWLLVATDYRIESGRLKIRSGPFRWLIPVADIHSVSASRSLLSSPALSLNRLEIEYGVGKSILVSPKDREGFLAALGHPNIL